MATVQKFEDLEVWKQGRILSKEIHGITRFPEFSKDYSLKDQIGRASGSVMDNIAEGFERSGNKEFKQFLYISKGSNGEVRSQLYRALDFNYIDTAKFNELFNLSTNIGVLLNNFIAYLAKSEMKGQKYKKRA